MRIDAHFHLWDLDRHEHAWTRESPVLHRSYHPADLSPALAAAGVDRAVLVQTVPEPWETPELLALAEEEEFIGAVVGWSDLTDPDLPAALDRLRGRPGGRFLTGLRHNVQDEPGTAWFTRPEVRQGLRALGAAGLAYDLLVRPDQLTATVALVRALPDVRFVLDHAGNPVIGPRPAPGWTAAMTALGELPNVAVKFSGLLTRTGETGPATALAPYAATLLGALGPRRVLFGSDWPVCRLTAEYDEVLAVTEELLAPLAPADRAAVLGTNAAAWYAVRD
ncbi:amidohydrolase family protein [Streptomyces sp. RTGN2]|uniref:amidohydrolase family protein n=1 Tax=unclassified Streptomyces TaxID=2593676 RepID=UPI002555534D|nr:amidohydrolase family protein [Streptomyces sp. RTGN2]WSU56533.1 amidohydrolase family protein [Streptomyces sp. NBC_01104]